jgi:hypothetical protein
VDIVDMLYTHAEKISEVELESKKRRAEVRCACFGENNLAVVGHVHYVH